MKQILLKDSDPKVSEILPLAQKEPLSVIAPSGQTFIFTDKEDYEFEKEAKQLASSEKFQSFLESRRGEKTYSIDEVRAKLGH